MSADEEELSAADLRQRVFSKLTQTGVVDSMKTQLRKQILKSLNFPLTPIDTNAGPAAKATPALGKTPSLRQQVANALIAEYMEVSGMPCSLSVFLPESGVGASAQLSRHDILTFLRLPTRLTSQHHKHGDTLAMNLQCLEPALNAADPLRLKSDATAENGPSPQNSLFFCLVEGLAQRAEHITRRADCVKTKDAQTDWHIDPCERDLQAPAAAAMQLEWKLDAVDRHFRSLAEQQARSDGNALLTMEERLSVLQREIAERCNKEAQLEIERVRSTEVSAVRIEEQARYQQQLVNIRDELETQYRQRMKDLHDRESAVEEAFRAKERDLESTAFEQRQKSMEEMARLRTREADAQRAREADLRALNTAQAALRERERAFEARAAEATAAAQQAQHSLAEERNRTAATLIAERSACDARVSQLNEELERVCQQLRDEQGRFAICSTEVQDAREELAALAELRAERDAVLRSRAQASEALRELASVRDECSRAVAASADLLNETRAAAAESDARWRARCAGAEQASEAAEARAQVAEQRLAEYERAAGQLRQSSADAQNEAIQARAALQRERIAHQSKEKELAASIRRLVAERETQEEQLERAQRSLEEAQLHKGAPPSEFKPTWVDEYNLAQPALISERAFAAVISEAAAKQSLPQVSQPMLNASSSAPRLVPVEAWKPHTPFNASNAQLNEFQTQRHHQQKYDGLFERQNQPVSPTGALDTSFSDTVTNSTLARLAAVDQQAEQVRHEIRKSIADAAEKEQIRARPSNEALDAMLTPLPLADMSAEQNQRIELGPSRSYGDELFVREQKRALEELRAERDSLEVRTRAKIDSAVMVAEPRQRVAQSAAPAAVPSREDELRVHLEAMAERSRAGITIPSASEEKPLMETPAMHFMLQQQYLRKLDAGISNTDAFAPQAAIEKQKQTAAAVAAVTTPLPQLVDDPKVMVRQMVRAADQAQEMKSQATIANFLNSETGSNLVKAAIETVKLHDQQTAAAEIKPVEQSKSDLTLTVEDVSVTAPAQVASPVVEAQKPKSAQVSPRPLPMSPQKQRILNPTVVSPVAKSGLLRSPSKITSPFALPAVPTPIPETKQPLVNVDIKSSIAQVLASADQTVTSPATAAKDAIASTTPVAEVTASQPVEPIEVKQPVEVPAPLPVVEVAPPRPTITGSTVSRGRTESDADRTAREARETAERERILAAAKKRQADAVAQMAAANVVQTEKKPVVIVRRSFDQDDEDDDDREQRLQAERLQAKQKEEAAKREAEELARTQAAEAAAKAAVIEDPLAMFAAARSPQNVSPAPISPINQQVSPQKDLNDSWNPDESIEEDFIIDSDDPEAY